MQNGANIHAVSAANQNALHYSAAVGATSIFNFFVAAGVDPYLECVRSHASNDCSHAGLLI